MRNRIARYHNIFGPEGTWRGGKEKTPAAICRKVAMARAGDEIEIWGDGSQTRSFLHVNECLEGTLWLMRSGTCDVSVNIGSEEMVTIDQLVDMVSDIAGKPVTKRHVSGPTGVRGRNSNTRLIREKLYWPPSRPLREGMQQTYAWIDQRVRANTDSGA
jgi:GDP-D-mannose 3', 5'-epimerase